MYLGVDRDTEMVFEGNGFYGAHVIWPSPMLTPAKFILASDIGTSVLKKADTFKTVYSNKTFDYMACKKPVLMAIDGVSRQLIETAEAGMFVEPENPQMFAEKILIYMNNKNLIPITQQFK